LPLKSIESDFAADSSGFATGQFSRWFDAKYGEEKQQHDWRANADAQLSEQMKSDFLRRYDRLVRKAEGINPPASKRKADRDSPKKKRVQQPTSRSLINRLQRRRDEVLRFMMDLSVPFDNNGSERDLRMVKLQQKIAGCFRTSDGARNFCRVRSYLSTARKQGYSLLCSLERMLKGKPLVFQ
jgi:transposase